MKVSSGLVVVGAGALFVQAVTWFFAGPSHGWWTGPTSQALPGLVLSLPLALAVLSYSLIREFAFWHRMRWWLALAVALPSAMLVWTMMHALYDGYGEWFFFSWFELWLRPWVFLAVLAWPLGVVLSLILRGPSAVEARRKIPEQASRQFAQGGLRWFTSALALLAALTTLLLLFHDFGDYQSQRPMDEPSQIVGPRLLWFTVTSEGNTSIHSWLLDHPKANAGAYLLLDGEPWMVVVAGLALCSVVVLSLWLALCIWRRPAAVRRVSVLAGLVGGFCLVWLLPGFGTASFLCDERECHGDFAGVGAVSLLSVLMGSLVVSSWMGTTQPGQETWFTRNLRFEASPWGLATAVLGVASVALLLTRWAPLTLLFGSIALLFAPVALAHQTARGRTLAVIGSSAVLAWAVAMLLEALFFDIPGMHVDA